MEFSSPGAARLFLANSSSTGPDRLAIAERGYSLRFIDPAAMLAWCEAAAVNLPPSIPASDSGLLLAHLGNAHRVSCNFQKAEIYLRQAHAAAPDNPRILEFYASLLKDKRELHEAAAFLSRAATLRRGSGDNAGHAKTLLNSSLVLDEAGFPDQAADGALGALEILGLLPPSEERERLARAGFQNLAAYLVHGGKAREALWVVNQCKDGLILGGEVFRLRVDWLTAQIVGALGEVESAVASYEEVRRRFGAHGLWQEVALVTLDLARLLLKPQPLRAREEALSVGPILESLGIAPDAREFKLLAEVVETGAELPLVQLYAAIRSARRA